MIVCGYEIKAKVDLHGANLRGAYLCEVDLHGANLHAADLCAADLCGADLDLSCWPLWCGSKGVRLDKFQKDQLCLHLYWVLSRRSPLWLQLQKAATRAAKRRNIELGD